MRLRKTKITLKNYRGNDYEDHDKKSSEGAKRHQKVDPHKKV